MGVVAARPRAWPARVAGLVLLALFAAYVGIAFLNSFLGGAIADSDEICDAWRSYDGEGRECFSTTGPDARASFSAYTRRVGLAFLGGVVSVLVQTVALRRGFSLVSGAPSLGEFGWRFGAIVLAAVTAGIVGAVELGLAGWTFMGVVGLVDVTAAASALPQENVEA